MSALLLDTHVWLWYAEGVAEQLPPSAVRLIDSARQTDGLLVSAISVWEIGTLCARGRIQLAMPLRDWVDEALAAPGIHFVPVDAPIAVESTLLPGEPHGDPADRLLIATARMRGAQLATRDAGIVAYGKGGFVRVTKV